MKFTKTLVAAALLASSAGANAAIQSASATGANEAWLSIYDATQKTTFTLDLGVSLATLFTNNADSNYSLSFDLDALSAASPNGKWSTFAANLDAAATSWGVMVAGGSKYAVTSETAIPKISILSGVTNIVTKINGHTSQVSTSQVIDNGGIANASQASTNLSSIVLDSDTAGTGQHNQPLPFRTLFGSNASADADINGATSQFWMIDGTKTPVVAAQEWKLDLAGAKLTYAAAPAAVPLPAAVWMFGAGLMGVLRATRRKSAV